MLDIIENENGGFEDQNFNLLGPELEELKFEDDEEEGAIFKVNNMCALHFTDVMLVSMSGVTGLY